MRNPIYQQALAAWREKPGSVFYIGSTDTAQTIMNQHGKTVLRLCFKDFEELERFFVEELIGSGMMKGSASKVIGTTLLIWDRN